MAEKKEELTSQTFEEEVKELRNSLSRLIELFLPPKEVREEVVKNIYNIELSFLRIMKALVDYKVQNLEEKASGQKKKKSKKIEVE
jgi:hypothetical protein